MSHSIRSRMLLAALSIFLTTLEPGQVSAASANFNKHYDVGSDFLARQEFQLAVREFDAALKDAGNDKKDAARALLQRGTAYTELKNYARAQEDLENSIINDGKSDLAYNNLGALYLRTLKAELAIQNFDQAIRLNPANKYAVVNRAGAYLMQSNPRAGIDNTVAWLDSGKNWQSDFAGHAACLTALAYLLGKDHGNFERVSDAALKRTDRLKWPFPVFQFFRGKKTAEDVLEKAEDSTYDLMQAQCFLALENFARGDFTQARTRLRFVEKHGAMNSVEYWVGKYYQNRINLLKPESKPQLKTDSKSVKAK